MNGAPEVVERAFYRAHLRENAVWAVRHQQVSQAVAGELAQSEGAAQAGPQVQNGPDVSREAGQSVSTEVVPSGSTARCQEFLAKEPTADPGHPSELRFTLASLCDLLSEALRRPLTSAEREHISRWASGEIEGVDRWAPERRGRSELIAFTVPPVVALERAVTSTASPQDWLLIDGSRLVHLHGKAGYNVAVDHADPVASVEDALREIGVQGGLEALFCVAAACHHALQDAGEPVHADDLLLDIGWQRNRDGARETRADAAGRIARLLLSLNSWNVIGERWGSFRDERGVRIDVSSRGPLFTTTVLDQTRGASGEGAAPVGFVFRPGEFLSRVRDYPHVLATFGTYRELAAMPRRRPADAWAVAVGLALVQRWRELGHRAKVTRPGDDNLPAVRLQKATRGYLLSQFPPEPEPSRVLADKSHGARNAKAYWQAAIHKLRLASVIDADTECRLAGDPEGLPRRGWRQAWLQEALDIRPSASYQAAFLALSAQAKRHRQAANRQHRGAAK
jgi:hypothetical protein